MPYLSHHMRPDPACGCNQVQLNSDQGCHTQQLAHTQATISSQQGRPQAPQPMPAPSSSLAPALEERASSLVDRYLPPSRASFQGGAGSYTGSYTGSHTGSLAAQTPLAAGTSSPFSTQDRGNHFQRAGSGLSVVPGSQVTFSGA